MQLRSREMRTLQGMVWFLFLVRSAKYLSSIASQGQKVTEVISWGTLWDSDYTEWLLGPQHKACLQDWGPIHNTMAILAPQQLTTLGSLETEHWHGQGISWWAAGPVGALVSFLYRQPSWVSGWGWREKKEEGCVAVLVPSPHGHVEISLEPSSKGQRALKICLSVC